MKKALYILSACALMLTASCSSDYLELQPNSSASTGTIFETTDNVKLAVNGLSMVRVQYVHGMATILATTTRRAILQDGRLSSTACSWSVQLLCTTIILGSIITR